VGDAFRPCTMRRTAEGNSVNRLLDPPLACQPLVLPISRFLSRAATGPEALAITGADGDITYAALRDRVLALAAAMQALAPEPGSRVGICARNSAAHLVALLAAYAAGRVWVPLSPRNAPAALDAMLDMTQPSLIVADASSLRQLSMPADTPLILLDAEEAADAKAETRRPVASMASLLVTYAGRTPTLPDRRDEDAQIIKFSGGSTGAPKPVVQSVRCLHAQADGIRDFFEFTDADVNLIVAPLTHGASCFVLPILERGGRHVLLDTAHPRTVLDTIARYGVTTLYAPPTLLYALMETSAPPPLTSLRHVIYSAAPMTPQRIRDCQQFFGPVIETAYGQVEAPQIICGMRADELREEANLLSVGRPSSVATVGIMNAAGALLPAGESGEIVVRGPLLMNGYLDRPEETARALVDGWLHTGDVGEIDERGYVFIRGRLRELINTGGFKVFPGEVEGALAMHPDVVECAVFGVPDAKWGEAVHAAVVLRAQVPRDEHALRDFVKATLGSVKAPKRIWWVDALARNAAGKVSRADVRTAVLGDSSASRLA